MPRDVLLAAIVGAQGLKGEVRAKLYTAGPEALPHYRVLHTKEGRKLEIRTYRNVKPGEAVIAFQGITDRNEAETLKGAQLFVSRDTLPQPADEEFYHTDLIGLEARDGDGRVIGKIAAIHNFGASDVIELIRSDGDSVHLAFTRETVPTIDVANGYVVVAVPEDEEPDHVE